MSDKISYSRVTVEQLIVMVNFMGQHADFATGNLRTMEARLASKKLWAKLAKLMNNCKTGIKKSPVGWSRYWSDYKNKIKKKMRLFQNGQHKLHPNSSKSLKPFTSLEKRALIILGPDFGKPSAEPVDSLIDLQDDFSSSVKRESLNGDASNGSSRVRCESLHNNSEDESGESVQEDVLAVNNDVLEVNKDMLELNEDSAVQTTKESNPVAEIYPNWLVKVEKKRASAELLRAKAEVRRSKVAAKNAEAAILQAEALHKLSEAAKVQAEAITRIANCLENKLSGTDILSI